MIRIRDVSINDAERLLKIYAPYVQNTAISFEYFVPSIETFAKRISRIIQKYPYIVAEENDIIVGYAYADEFKGREAFKWTVETSIYIDEKFKNKGIGRILYDCLEQKLRNNSIQSMCACIAYTERCDDPYLTNDSIIFHQKLGFKTVAHFHRCGWKFSQWYDIVWMEKLL